MAQSAEDHHAIAMQRQVSELEALVCAACARGVDACRCRDVIEGAVRRARLRGAMLSHLGSGLLLSTLEASGKGRRGQTKSEIVGLTDVAATNAAVMADELLHDRELAEESAVGTSNEELAGASTESQPGCGAGPPGPGATSRSVRFEDGARSAPSDHDPCVGGLAPATPVSKAPSVGSSLSAGDAVAPMRDFASEVAAEAAAEADEDRCFRHTLSMKTSKSGDFRLARAYDFGTAQSPRASYHSRDANFAFAPLDPAGADTSMLWRPPPGGPAAASGEGEGERAGAELLVYSRAAEEEPVLDAEHTDWEEAPRSPAARPACAPASPRSGGLSPRRPHGGGGLSPRRPYGGGCWPRCSSIPPGLNPMAAVEGGVAHDTIDPHSPTGVGAVDLASFSSAPFSLHSVTPPHHVMRELAAEVAGRLAL